MTTDRDRALKFGPYVHMSPEETPIWDKWLQGEGADSGPYQYDVQVGDPITLADTATDLERTVANALTRKRIDAIHLTPTAVTIYEVKKRAGLTAVGQIQGYGFLYRRQHPTAPPITLVILTDLAQPNAIEYAASQGVTLKELL